MSEGWLDFDRWTNLVRRNPPSGFFCKLTCFVNDGFLLTNPPPPVYFQFLLLLLGRVTERRRKPERRNSLARGQSFCRNTVEGLLDCHRRSLQLPENLTWVPDACPNVMFIDLHRVSLYSTSSGVMFAPNPMNRSYQFFLVRNHSHSNVWHFHLKGGISPTWISWRCSYKILRRSSITFITDFAPSLCQKIDLTMYVTEAF